jgi:hypothetical protein
MSHPTEQLTDYVDGTLTSRARAEADAHVRGCATCRAELALATAGKRAVAGLERPVAPAGVADAAIAEAERRAATGSVRPISAGSRRRPNAQRWVTVLGAAAVVALVALVAPKLGNAPTTDAASMAAGAGAADHAAYPTATAVEIQKHVQYTLGGLPSQAAQMRAAFALSTANDGAVAQPAAPTAGTFSSGAPAEAATTKLSAARLSDATACLNRAFGQPEGSLARVIQAEFDGQSAFFGVYLTGPGADLPPDALHLDVAAVHGCRILAQSTARL